MALLPIRFLLIGVIGISATGPAFANSSTIETSGTAVAIALPLTAAGVALWKQDGTGVKELAEV
ncbi:MAG TPA: hypothetical protein VHU18_04895, partial [Rhizomicrobium sp.]|nr:hypothetical protein [Rhizomicrobium sp.]